MSIGAGGGGGQVMHSQLRGYNPYTGETWGDFPGSPSPFHGVPVPPSVSAGNWSTDPHSPNWVGGWSDYLQSQGWTGGWGGPARPPAGGGGGGGPTQPPATATTPGQTTAAAPRPVAQQTPMNLASRTMTTPGYSTTMPGTRAPGATTNPIQNAMQQYQSNLRSQVPQQYQQYLPANFAF